MAELINFGRLSLASKSSGLQEGSYIDLSVCVDPKLSSGVEKKPVPVIIKVAFRDGSQRILEFSATHLAYIDLRRLEELKEQYQKAGIDITDALVLNHAMLGENDVRRWHEEGLIAEDAAEKLISYIRYVQDVHNRVGRIWEEKCRLEITELNDLDE